MTNRPEGAFTNGILKARGSSHHMLKAPTHYAASELLCPHSNPEPPDGL